MKPDLYYHYNPEPSKTILQKGQIVDGSYFLADGRLHFDEGKPIDCEFEVAHMQDGMCWAVVYVKFPEEQTPWEQDQLEKRLRYAIKVTGKDRVWQRDVEVFLLAWMGQKGGLISSGLRLIFMVGEYEVTIIPENERQSSGTMFCIANLPIAVRYSPKRTVEAERAKFAEEMEDKALKTALEKVILLSNDPNHTQKELLDIGLKEAQETKESLMNDSTPLYRAHIPFRVGDEIIAKLFWLTKLDDRQFQTQPLAALSINPAKIPSGWTARKVAEWICGLLSLSLGRMISWHYYYIPPKERDGLSLEEHWISRTFQLGTFTAFTEERSYLGIHGLEESSYAITLVEEGLSFIFQQPIANMDEYLSTLNDYVYYASAPADAQHRCTLLCALVESLFSTWEKQTKPQIEDEIKKSHRKKLLDAIETEITNLLCDVLPPELGETADRYEKRCKSFIERMRSSVGLNLSHSFVHRLKWLFEQHGWYTNTTYSGLQNMGHRTEVFVESRNKLFHEHRFAADDIEKFPDQADREQELLVEIKNIEMFVPIMLTTLLQYRGRYWDTMQNRHGGWAWMPKREEH